MSRGKSATEKNFDHESLTRVITELTNRIHNLEEENEELKNLIQKLKDEIRRLKGEKGRPIIKSPLLDNPPTTHKNTTKVYFLTDLPFLLSDHAFL